MVVVVVVVVVVGCMVCEQNIMKTGRMGRRMMRGRAGSCKNEVLEEDGETNKQKHHRAL